MLSGFKQFILRGNVVDLAVGVVIGAAFAGVVTGLTSAFLNPLIKLATGGGEKFSSLQFTIRGVQFPLDSFINACISFVLIAAAFGSSSVGLRLQRGCTKWASGAHRR